MRAYTQMRSAIADRWARASSRGWDEMRNSELSLRGWLRILLASLFAVFVLTVPSAFSAETPTEVPSSLVAPLGTDRQAAVVPYEDLLKVARKGQLNAATVDAACRHRLGWLEPHPQRGAAGGRERVAPRSRL